MKKEKFKDLYIKTDFCIESDFFENYMTDEWEDSNILYSEYVSEATNGKQMNKFFVQEIKNFDRKLLKAIKNIWNEFEIRPKEFRCNFFKVLPGGELPLHVDVKSKSSILIPVTENTGSLIFEDHELLYQTMIALNTQKPHGVKSPTKERIVFHMGLHDVSFEDLK